MNLPQWLGSLEWHYPVAWWLALVPLALWLLSGLRHRRALRYAEAPLRPWAVRDERKATPGWIRAARAALRLFAWILLAAALAGPRLAQLRTGTAEHLDASRADVDLMVVLQVPFRPQDPVARAYLGRVWVELQDLGSRLHGERLGLVAYNGRAGMLATPTSDQAAFRFYLHRAGKVLAGWRGNALAEALARAGVQLATARAAGRSGGIILLAAGGSSPDPDALGASLHRLREAHVPVYALDMSAFTATLLARHPRSRAFGVPRFGSTSAAEHAPDSTPNSKWLHEVVSATDGVYARLDNGDADWRRLYDDGAAELPSHPGARERSGNLVRTWRELYAWCLAPALLLLLIDAVGFDRRAWFGGRALARAGSLLVCSLIAAGTGWPIRAAAGGAVTASDPGEAKGYASAYAAYAAQDYALAQLRFDSVPGYAARLGEGASAYRRGDYRSAARQFTRALLAAGDAHGRASALFDLGNARFQLHQYHRAVEAYRGALRYSAGDDARIRANLWLARSRLGQQVHHHLRPLAAGSGLPARRGEPPAGFPDETPPTISSVRRGPHSEVGQRVARGEVAARPDVGDDEGGAGDSDEAVSPRDRGVLKLLDLVGDHATALLRGVITHEPAPGASPAGGRADSGGPSSP